MGSEGDEDLCFNGHARQHIDRLIDIVVLRFHKHVKCPALAEMLLRVTTYTVVFPKTSFIFQDAR